MITVFVAWLASAFAQSPPDPARAQQVYEENYVWFEGIHHYVSYTLYGIPMPPSYAGTSFTPYKGKYREPLRGARFYSHIGERGLATRYRAAAVTRNLIAWPSLGLLAVGLGRLAVGAIELDPWSMCFGDETPEPCGASAKHVQERYLARAGVLAGGGLVGFTIAAAIPRHPARLHERRKMAESYNARLRASLGLPSEPPPAE